MRIFLAINPPDEVRRRVWEATAPLRLRFDLRGSGGGLRLLRTTNEGTDEEERQAGARHTRTTRHGRRRITVGATIPDLTFVLDVPADVGLARAGDRRGAEDADRFESEALEFHQKLRAGFRALAKSEPNRCILIDATAPRPDVAAQIWSIVEQRLHPAAPPSTIGEAAP